MSSRLWLNGTDAVTGLALMFHVDQIAVIREARNTTFVVLASGLQYEVEGEYKAILSTLGLTLPEASDDA